MMWASIWAALLSKTGHREVRMMRLRIPANRLRDSRHRDMMEPTAVQRQEWQIVQS